MPKLPDNQFLITLDSFSVGQSPLAHLDSLTSLGKAGHYSVASNVDVISKPGLLTQGPGLANLTNGTEADAVKELINYIMDKAVADNVTYGTGGRKLFKITSTEVINASPFPYTIDKSLIEDCEDAWNESVDADVTSTADTADKRVGAASAKLVVAAAAAAGDILATEIPTNSKINLSNATQVILWIKCSVATAAGDLQLLLDNTANCASPLEAINIPALSADTWTQATLTLANPASDIDIISVGLKYVVDIGACTIWIDDVRSNQINEVGSSVIDLNGNLYGFYNHDKGGDILKYNLDATFDLDWGSTIPTNHAELQKAPHPVAVKEDIMLFGNGRYVGTYIEGSNTLAPTKLDFKQGNEVADVLFHANQWWIAVNSGISGVNRNMGQVFLYDGSATSALLSDEVAIGVQKIGWIYPLNGIVYICYQDLSSAGGFVIGYIAGRQIKPLRYFTGSLPNFQQKTLFKNTILFISSGLVYSCGAVIEQLPVQLSQLADGGYATCGAIACPFGTPMIASTESTNYKLAKFSGYDKACNWRSIVIPIVAGRMLGYIDEVVVFTKALGDSARCDLILETDQAVTSSTTQQIKTTGKTRHVFTNLGLGASEDVRVFLNWANGSATNDCAIRSGFVRGHYVEK